MTKKGMNTHFLKHYLTLSFCEIHILCGFCLILIVAVLLICIQNVIVVIKKRSDFWSNLLISSSRDDRI